MTEFTLKNDIDTFIFSCDSTITHNYDTQPTGTPATNFLIHFEDNTTTELKVDFCTPQRAFLPAFICIDGNYIVESFYIDKLGFHLLTEYDDGADMQGIIDLRLYPSDWYEITKEIHIETADTSTTLNNLPEIKITGIAAKQVLEVYKVHYQNRIVKNFGDDLLQNKISLNYALEKTKPLRANPIFQKKINYFLTEYMNQNGQDKHIKKPKTGKKKANFDAIRSYFFYRKKGKLKHDDAINHVLKIYPSLSYEGLSEQIKNLTKNEKAEFNAIV